MKKRNLTYLGGLAALAVAGIMLSQHADVDLTTDALAVDATSTMTTNCTESALTAFVPSVSVTAVIPAAAATAAAPSNATSTISFGSTVDGEAATVAQTQAGFTSPKLNIAHKAPKMKLGGLLCRSLSAATLDAVNNLGTQASTTYDIYAGDGGSINTTAANRIDNTVSVPLFNGTGGKIETASITDAGDGSTNGEVVFGDLTGVDVDADLRWHMTHSIDVVGISPDGQSETVKFVFSGV